MGKWWSGGAYPCGWVVILALGCASEVDTSDAVVGGQSTTTSGGFGGSGAECGVGGGFASGGGTFFGGGGTGADGGFDVGVEATVPETRPPPISGGTLLVTRGDLAVAADPARDRIYVAAVSSILEKLHEIELEPGSEPGRLVEDGAGLVHVALRKTGELVRIDPEAGEIQEQRHVCDHPRGVAYDEASDSLHVACAEGRLVTLPAAGGEATRNIEVADDLRDVVVRGDQLWVSTFRSAQLIKISSEGEIVEQTSPPALVGPEPPPQCGEQQPERPRFDATVAWRTTPLADGGVAMLHQRSLATVLNLDDSRRQGYGSASCLGIVQSVVSIFDDQTQARVFPAMVRSTLAVDVAVSPNAENVAVAVAGNEANVMLTTRTDLDDKTEYAGEPLDGDDMGCLFDFQQLSLQGQVTSVAFASNQRLVALTRQPVRMYLYDLGGGTSIEQLTLSAIDVSDSGHELFHHDLGRGIACASCHPEAREDGHVWNFADVGPRRTQELRGGILGTEPLHWAGELAQFDNLVEEVMQRRMGGPSISQEQIDALAGWIDAQPDLVRTGLDADAVERGRAIFESDETQCSVCHEGPTFTNNKNEDVGTGLPLQVPSLNGVSFRAPYMHDGCAQTLEDRFGNCGGGDDHGKTSQLSKSELGDLIEYLESL